MNGYRVLLVEDDPGDAELMRLRLEQGPEHLNVTHAETLTDALVLLSNATFDAVVLDLRLPDSEGLEAVSQVRDVQRGLPVVVVSGLVDETIQARLADSGAEEIFNKNESNSPLFSRSVLYVIERARVRSREKELEQVLETTPDAILVVTKEGVIRYVNNAALLLFDVERAELVGEQWGVAVGKGPSVEIEVPRADGTRVCEMRVVDLDWKGESAFLASIRDVTEQRLTERLRARSVELELQNSQIQEANRLKTEFLANMSHELRTPLNAIIGFSQILHQGAVDPASQQHQEFLGDILTSGRHLLQLINDILDLSKVEAGKMEFRPELLDLDQLIGEVVAVLRTLAAEKQVRLEVSLDQHPALRTVELDPARFKQVLYNYVANAIKFTPAGGQAIVRTRYEDEHFFRVEVEDSGIGIAPEGMSKLFVEFEQLNSGMSKTHQGSGLGLALTRRIVEAQGGSVGVSSTPNEGSKFYAVLPLSSVSRQRAWPSPTSIAVREVEKRGRVLVVEDEPRDQEFLVATLSAAGYGVEVASSGAEALEKCSRKAFDAVTLDLLLPDMNCLDLLAEIRNSGQSRDAIAIVVTVMPDRSISTGYAVHEVLHKPLHAEELVRALERAGVNRDENREVVIVDDDPLALRLIENALEGLGFCITSCSDAESALHAASVRSPAAVVLDLLMPDMDGFEFLDRLRSTAQGAQVPVFIWTAKQLTHDEQERLQAAAQGILAKLPTTDSRLLQELGAWLSVRTAAEGMQ